MDDKNGIARFTFRSHVREMERAITTLFDVLESEQANRTFLFRVNSWWIGSQSVQFCTDENGPKLPVGRIFPCTPAPDPAFEEAERTKLKVLYDEACEHIKSLEFTAKDLAR